MTDNSTISKIPLCEPERANVSIVITADLSPVFKVPPGGFRGYVEENAPAGTSVANVSNYLLYISPLIKVKIYPGPVCTNLLRSYASLFTKKSNE